MRILVTGGLGFIGSSVIRNLITKEFHKIINLDNETYAANKKSLSSIENNSKYFFIKGDIVNKKIIEEVARQLGVKITYLNTLNSQGVSSKKIVIEYDVEEKV